MRNLQRKIGLFGALGINGGLNQSDGSYCNPILPADFSDLDCIRVGSDYYAISSTFQYAPGMVVLHSTDLSTIGGMVGFTVMMLLDVALG